MEREVRFVGSAAIGDSNGAIMMIPLAEDILYYCLCMQGTTPVRARLVHHWGV